MADQDRPIQPEGVDHIEHMQGDAEHVAQALRTFRIGVARQQRREHMPAPGESREKRVVLGQPAGAVQKDERRAVARLEHADLAAPSRNIERV